MKTLAIVEILGRNGEVLHRERLSSLPAIVGRGFDTAVTLDDPHVAAHHLRIEATNGDGFVLTQLETRNGFSIPARKQHRQLNTAEIMAGETIRFGHSQIRIWHPESVVSPEVPITHNSNPTGWLLSALWIVTALGLMGTFAWIEATGPSRDGTVSTRIMMTAIFLFVWSGVWWVSSRSSNRADAYITHLGVAASMVSFVLLGQYVTNTAFFAFDLHRYGLDYVPDIVLGASFAYGVYRHLRLVSRKSRVWLGTLSIIVVAALLAPYRFISNQDDLEKMGLLDIPASLRPPWMQVTEGMSVEEFLK